MSSWGPQWWIWRILDYLELEIFEKHAFCNQSGVRNTFCAECFILCFLDFESPYFVLSLFILDLFLLLNWAKKFLSLLLFVNEYIENHKLLYN